jgi:hypothetical protein
VLPALADTPAGLEPAPARAALAGSFGYMPAKMVHEAWTKEDGAMYFITVDGLFEINWVK